MTLNIDGEEAVTFPSIGGNPAYNFFTFAIKYNEIVSIFLQMHHSLKGVAYQGNNRKLVPNDEDAYFRLTKINFSAHAALMNACMSSELFMKAIVLFKDGSRDLSTASKEMRAQYGHNISTLAIMLEKELLLTKKDIRYMKQASDIYNFGKRLQYPSAMTGIKLDLSLKEHYLLNEKIQKHIENAYIDSLREL